MTQPLTPLTPQSDALLAAGLLDAPHEAALERIINLAAELLRSPRSTIVLAEHAPRRPSRDGVYRGDALSEAVAAEVLAFGAVVSVDDSHSHPLRRSRDDLHTGSRACAGAPILAADGQIMGSLCVSDNVPRLWLPEDLATLGGLASVAAAALELRREASALEEREEALAELLDHTDDLVYATGPRDRIAYVNAAWCNALGYTPHEALRMDAASIVVEVHRSQYQDCVARVANGEAISDFETVFVAKDGRRIVCRGRMERRASGYGTRVSVRDVTEMRRMEAMRARLASTLEASTDLALIITVEGGIVWVNRAARRILGLRPGDRAARSSAWELHPPAESERMRTIAVPAAVREETWEGETSIIDENGEVIPVSLVMVAHPSTWPGEPPHFVSAVMRDLRERVRAERAKSQMIGLASHELRTPLTAIRGALELLRSRSVGKLDDSTRTLLETAERNAERLARMANGLLDVQRLESGGALMEPIDISSRELLDIAEEVTLGNADSAGVSVNIGGDDTLVRVDPDGIVRVLTNLLGNAIKFSPRGSTVEIRSDVDGTSVLFSVRDRGRGIPQDRLEAIFEPFIQVEPGDAHERGGAGLGLAICRAIVQQHGGRIWAESAEGTGSVFRFTVPQAPRTEY